MKTNKLLTLEEIEDIERHASYSEYPKFKITYVKVLAKDYNGLLATARAYWELKEQQTSELVEIGKQDNSKPHAPTIQAIVEALGYIKHVDNSTGAELAIKSLEKHLE